MDERLENIWMRKENSKQQITLYHYEVADDLHTNRGYFQIAKRWKTTIKRNRSFIGSPVTRV
jgi:hypothetical protein